jgi:hypothetical protein
MASLYTNYCILKNHNLVIEYYSGVLEFDSLVNFKLQISKDALFTKKLKHLIYLKDVIFNTKPIDVKNYVSFLEKNSSIFGERYVALITATPKQVVNSTLYKLKQKNINQKLEVFSTISAAINWLSLEISEEEVYTILSKLSNKTISITSNAANI